MPLGQCRWASKHMSGHFAHSKNMVRWKQCSADQCPRCGLPREDKSHIIRCQHESATKTWDDALTNLKEWLKTEQTDPQLIELLLTELNAWRNNEPHSTTSPVAQAQTAIRWDAVLDGWLSLEWQATQSAYWQQWKRRKSSKRWTSELIKKLLNVSWDMWEHRNAALHHSTLHQADIIESKINNQIRETFALGLRDLPRDAFPLFHDTVEELLQKPRSYKEQWLDLVNAAKRRKQHHEHGTYIQEQRFMRRWLGIPET